MENESNKIIVDNIREIAKRQSMTIKDVETELGFGNGMIGKWAKAPRMPSIDRLEAIADLLGVTLADLTGKKEERPQSGTPNRDALLQLINGIDDVGTLLVVLDAVNRKLQEHK